MDRSAIKSDAAEPEVGGRVRRQRRKMQRVTMMDVANRAGVSSSTVSLYLRRPDAVSPAAGQEIAQALEALGYVPNLVAGGLAAAGSRVVSVIVPSIRNAFFAETVASLQTELAAEGLQVMLGHSEYSETDEEALIRTALAWAPAAIVLTGLSHSIAARKLLTSAGVPVVEMWELGAQAPVDMAVGFSHTAVGATAARHFAQQGFTRLAFLGARLSQDRRAAARAEGFVAEAVRLGLPEPQIINHPAPATAEAGAQLLGRVQANLPGLQAVACSNDLIALGVLFECQRRGVTVPGDLAVIGFGDLSFSSTSNPPLTTIRPSGDLIGREVARLIKASAHGERPPEAERIVDTGHLLVERKSG